MEYADIVTDQKGLWIKDTPGREIEILTGMAATGAQCILFSTGRGAPQGFPILPVLKIAAIRIPMNGCRTIWTLMQGRIIEGRASIEEVGEEAFAHLLRSFRRQTKVKR